MMLTAVKSCVCRSPFQDERYGRGKRLHNYGEKRGNKTGKSRFHKPDVGGPGYVCTVCCRNKGGA